MRRHFFTWFCTFLIAATVLWGLFDAHLEQTRAFAAEAEIFDVYQTPKEETAFCLFGNRYILNGDAVETTLYSAKEVAELEEALLPGWVTSLGGLWGGTVFELARDLGALMDES